MPLTMKQTDPSDIILAAANGWEKIVRPGGNDVDVHPHFFVDIRLLPK